MTVVVLVTAAVVVLVCPQDISSRQAVVVVVKVEVTAAFTATAKSPVKDARFRKVGMTQVLHYRPERVLMSEDRWLKAMPKAAGAR